MVGFTEVVLNAPHSISRLRLALPLLLACACSGGLPTEPDARAPLDPPPAPIPGWIQLRFTTPSTNDGAVQLTVMGGTVDSVAIESNFSGYAGVGEGGTARLLVTGAIVSGRVARLRVPDVNRISGYYAVIGQVAVRGTYDLRTSTHGYQASVSR